MTQYYNDWLATHREACDAFHAVTDHDRGEIFCGGCGVVMAESLPNPSHEGITYSAEDYASQTRTGPATSLLMHDRGLSTVIGSNRDSSGNALPAMTRSKFGRLRIWDQRSKSRSAASMSKAFTMLQAMKAKMAVPDNVAERAAYVYRKAVAAKLTRGRTVASLVSASLYVACRENDIPRTLDDIVAVSNVEKKVLFRDLRTILNKLEITLGQCDQASLVARLANNLDLPEKTKRDAIVILERGRTMMLTAGKHPVALAAAALYIAALRNGDRVTQRAVSRAASVSDVTVRNSMSLMRKALPEGAAAK